MPTKIRGDRVIHDRHFGGVQRDHTTFRYEEWETLQVIKLLLSVLPALLTCTIPAIAQAVSAFVAIGNLTTPRIGYTATLLPNGKVLIAGGIDHGDSYALRVSAELYDPVTGMFAPTGNMTTGRSGHSAARKPESVELWINILRHSLPVR